MPFYDEGAPAPQIDLTLEQIWSAIQSYMQECWPGASDDFRRRAFERQEDRIKVFCPKLTEYDEDLFVEGFFLPTRYREVRNGWHPSTYIEYKGPSLEWTTKYEKYWSRLCKASIPLESVEDVVQKCKKHCSQVIYSEKEKIAKPVDLAERCDDFESIANFLLYYGLPRMQRSFGEHVFQVGSLTINSFSPLRAGAIDAYVENKDRKIFQFRTGQQLYDILVAQGIINIIQIEEELRNAKLELKKIQSNQD